MVGEAKLPFAKAVEADGFLFLSGTVGMDDEGRIVPGGIIAEAEQAIANIRSVLDEAGYGLENVVKATCWLDDPRDYALFNRVFKKHFGAALPARSAVASLLVIDAKVEIEVVAYKKS